jgi:hypothetical protein
MLIVISSRMSTSVNTPLLNTLGMPYTRKASFKQSTQKDAPTLLVMLQLRTLLEYQSMIATRQAKPRYKRI